MKYLLVCFIIFSCLSNNVICTLSKSDKPSTKNKLKIKEGPQDDSVLDRDLVVSEPSASDILKEHATYYRKTQYRNFNGAVLGYVTPWNSHGYDVAKIFAPKFTNISPVWLQIRRSGPNKYEVTGTHDIDRKWISSLRNRNTQVHIEPRLFFDGWTVQDFTALFAKTSERQALIEAILTVCTDNHFDGIVLELWSQVGGSVRSDILVDFVKTIGLKLREKELNFILVVPPSRGGDRDIFTAQDFNALYDFVTGFSLMTYDFSNPQRPGPNSPLEWVRQCVLSLAPEAGKRRSKILLGLNLYGNSYTSTGGGPILGRDVIQLLNNNYKGKIKFDDSSVENFFEVRSPSGKQMVFYPTLYSIHQRIKLAEELGTGLSLWELGQGLDYFYDLF